MKLLTIAAIWVLTAVNIRGVHLGGGIQVLLTALKVGAILVLVVLGLSAIARGLPETAVAPSSLSPPSGAWALIAAFAAALAGAFWAYEGWNNITYVAGEIRSADRIVPRALIVGMLAVTVIYLFSTSATLRPCRWKSWLAPSWSVLLLPT
ncbi:MAG: amino acid permease [Candidatus Kapabacteria bacterium]|nr:amino acid permease [Candidatus Kapabacteria bacterium]MDW8012262.1 amino acid permease [Bacteroidota bacterium]